MLRTGASFSQRFIALTVAGYVTAVIVAIVAVWTGASPVLKRLQDQTIQEKAEANARATQIALREIALQTQFLATNPEIVKVAVGDAPDTDRALDHLHEFSHEWLVSIYVLDFEAKPVLRHMLRSISHASFQGFERRGTADIILSQADPSFFFSARPGRDGEHHFLIGQPIRQNGSVEGVLITEVAFDLSTLFAESTSIGTTELITAFQKSMMDTWSESEDAHVVPVENSNFYMVLRPNRSTISSAGEEIVNSVLLAVGVFLVFPFGAMCLAGYRSIVAPHRALERSQSELRENQKKLRELADISQRSNDAIVATNLDGRITWVNPAFTVGSGFSADEVMGKTPGEVLQGTDTDPEERERIAAALRDLKPIRSEILNYRKDGTPYWNSISIVPQFDTDGKPYRFVSISTDITEKRRAQDEAMAAKAAIEYQANHDALTGLPNRRALDAVLDSLKREQRRRVLVRIDLDHFKNVNDTFGHAAGDHVLKVVSDILNANIRDGDMAARVGGDEFVILMAPQATHEQAKMLSERLLVEIQKEIPYEDKICRIGASFGVATARPGLLSNAELLVGADAALYVAKEKGRNLVVSYTPELHEDVVATRRMAKEVENAFLRDEFVPFFQPQFDAQTFEFRGVEALVRWHHPERGILPPADFLKTVEQLSFLDKLDSHVLRRGVEAVADLQNQGVKIPKVSFNVMASRLEDPDIPELAHELACDGTKICFEVLETVLIEEQSELFNARVEFLRDIGFGIEVDDFGSGHASIIGLTNLAPDAMKIDQRLIFPITESPSARKMVRAVVEIGRALDISITAEGVETPEHAQILSEVGVTTLQGYLFAKPMSAKDLVAFLENYDAAAFKASCITDEVAKRIA